MKSLPSIQPVYSSATMTTPRHSKTPSLSTLPPILQKEYLQNMFSPLEKYMSNLEEAYPNVKDNPQKLKELEKKLDNFTTWLRELNMIIIGVYQSSAQTANIPANIKKKILDLSNIVLSLDRRIHHNFIAKFRVYNNQIIKRAVDLGNKISWASYSRVVSQRRQLPAPVLPEPPRLRRSTERFFS